MSLAADVLSALLNGLVTTVASGALVAFVAREFTTRRTARIAGFCVALGYAVGRFGYSGPSGSAAAVAFGAMAGSALALAGFWFWWLRKPEPE